MNATIQNVIRRTQLLLVSLKVSNTLFIFTLLSSLEHKDTKITDVKKLKALLCCEFPQISLISLRGEFVRDNDIAEVKEEYPPLKRQKR